MALIALLIAVILLLFLIWYFWPTPQGVAGTIGVPAGGAGTAPSNVVANWVNPAASITVGTPETFTLHVQNNNPTGSPQLTDVVGRHYTFAVGPEANISIVSVSPAASGPANTASTNGSGQIEVVIQANSIPPINPGEDAPVGSLVAISPADPGTRITATFTVQ